MSEKYTIKNCPACRQYNVFGMDDKPCCYNEMKYCQDITDCLLKKIVEKCKENIEFIKNNNLPLITATTDNKIIKMLDIEECE